MVQYDMVPCLRHLHTSSLLSFNMILTSWIPLPENSEFSLQNCPYGVFSPQGSTDCRCGTRIGDTLIDLSLLEEAALFDDLAPPGIFRASVLNPFLECHPTVWHAVRNRLIDLFNEQGVDTRLRTNLKLQLAAFHSIENVQLHLPLQVGDYTDFYSSREHATNVGIMFRGKDNALQPNWLHLPVGYHGRASTVQVSGQNVTRPMGQLQKDPMDPTKGSVYGPCKLLDFELEMAAVVGGPPNQGPLTMAQAKERLFGYMLMNDWSARDIQKWEYVPLGPFTSKNFATTVAPWIVPAQALEAFRAPTSAVVQDNPEPLDYLKDPDYSSYDVELTVAIQPAHDDKAHVVSKSNFKHLYWNPPQQLVHHSVTGCVMKAGDLLGSGTISGTEPTSFGSMLELSWKGTRDVPVGDKVRKFLCDGDHVIMRACCEKEGWGRVGFGECRGQVLPAVDGPSESVVDDVQEKTSTRYKDLRLYGYYKSSSTWRVRMALQFKGIPYELTPIDLVKKENISPEYLEIGAAGQVPVLECVDSETDKRIRLAQSVAIIDFLEEAFPESRSVYPRDLQQKARAKEMAEVVNASIQPLQNVFYLQRLEERSGGTLSAKAQAQEVISKGLATLESLAKRNQMEFLGPCCAGSFSPTLAEFFVLPQLANARRFGVEVVTAYPTLIAVENRFKDKDWYKLSHPTTQPDFKP